MKTSLNLASGYPEGKFPSVNKPSLYAHITQQQIFSIPKIHICGGGYIIKGSFCLWAFCILWHGDIFNNNSRVSSLLLDAIWRPTYEHSSTISWQYLWIFHMELLSSTRKNVCDYIYTHSSFPGPQFCPKFIAPPLTRFSFASPLWKLPSEPETHYSPSWKQTLQSDASSTTWGFHLLKPL